MIEDLIAPGGERLSPSKGVGTTVTSKLVWEDARYATVEWPSDGVNCIGLGFATDEKLFEAGEGTGVS
jgi:hypothetical protein